MYKPMKHCRRCFEVKPADQFSPRKGTRDRRASWCKTCKRQAQAESRRRNPEYDKKTYQKRRDRELAMKQLRYVSRLGRLPADLNPDEMQFCRRQGKIAFFRTSREQVKIHNGIVSREKWLHVEHRRGEQR